MTLLINHFKFKKPQENTTQHSQSPLKHTTPHQLFTNNNPHYQFGAYGIAISRREV